jgi:hypothetical protein
MGNEEPQGDGRVCHEAGSAGFPTTSLNNVHLLRRTSHHLNSCDKLERMDTLRHQVNRPGSSLS